MKYEVANGVLLENEGEKAFFGHSTEGVTKQVRAQVCDVNKALLSVSQVVKKGNREGESYIEDRNTGQVMWLREDNGMFLLKLWVKNSGF